LPDAVDPCFFIVGSLEIRLQKFWSRNPSSSKW
jgi:hypothetical protein